MVVGAPPSPVAVISIRAAPHDLVRGLVDQDRFSYQHRWQPGDVLMSDNRRSMHRASEWDEDNDIRRLHRIIMIDDKAPF